MAYLTPDQASNLNISDDDLASILGLSSNATQQDRLGLELKLANALRQKDQAKGQVVPGGSVFIPPNPLTTAMDTFDRLQGTVSAMQGKKEGGALDAVHQRGVSTFVKLWRQLNQNNQDPNADPNQGPPKPTQQIPASSDAQYNSGLL